MSDHAALIARLHEDAPELAAKSSEESSELTLTVDSDSWGDVALQLREAGFDRLDMVTAVDRDKAFEIVCRLRAADAPAGVFLKTLVPREDPRIASLTGVWPAAIWQEREVFDLFGITFEGHPDLRRILLPEDWVGHPLRKDYEDERLIRRPDYI